MSDERRLFDPGVGQTEQERFVQIDRAAAGLPPKGYKSWDELKATARQDYEANRADPEIHESTRGIKSRIEREAQKDTIKYYGAKAARIRRTIAEIEASLERIHNLMASEPDTYKSADKAMVIKLEGARMELKRCLGRIAEARRRHDNQDG